MTLRFRAGFNPQARCGSRRRCRAAHHAGRSPLRPPSLICSSPVYGKGGGAPPGPRRTEVRPTEDRASAQRPGAPRPETWGARARGRCCPPPGGGVRSEDLRVCVFPSGAVSAPSFGSAGRTGPIRRGGPTGPSPRPCAASGPSGRPTYSGRLESDPRPSGAPYPCPPYPCPP